MTSVFGSPVPRVRFSGCWLAHVARIALTVAMAVAVTVAVAGCGVVGNDHSDVTPRAFEPGLWSSSDGRVSVEFRSDGTGEFVNLPWWSGSPFNCSLEGTVPVSDTFIWNYSASPDKVLIAADNASVVTSFEPAGNGSGDWNTILNFVCMPDLPGRIILFRED
jgi:hypothetical protein